MRLELKADQPNKQGRKHDISRSYKPGKVTDQRTDQATDRRSTKKILS